MLKLRKLSARLKAKAAKAKKAVKAVKAEVPVVDDDSAGKKSVSKTTTTNIDNIIRLLINHFKLNEKEVKTTLADFLPSTSEFKKRGKKKDPNAPKKGLSAYMFFTMDRREQVKTDQPELGFTDITKRLGEIWREMSDSDKAPYQKQADKDKVRYDNEMAKYREENGITDTKKKNDKADNPELHLKP